MYSRRPLLQGVYERFNPDKLEDTAAAAAATAVGPGGAGEGEGGGRRGKGEGVHRGRDTHKPRQRLIILDKDPAY